MTSRTRIYLRAGMIALGLLPLALVARCAASETLMEFVQRHGAKVWKSLR